MKQHWINIRYDFGWTYNDQNERIGYEYFKGPFVYNGLVTGLEENGKVYIDPVKLFENAFKRKWYGRCTISYG